MEKNYNSVPTDMTLWKSCGDYIAVRYPFIRSAEYKKTFGYIQREEYCERYWLMYQRTNYFIQL